MLAPEATVPEGCTDDDVEAAAEVDDRADDEEDQDTRATREEREAVPGHNPAPPLPKFVSGMSTPARTED